MVDAKMGRDPQVSRREFEALRTRTNRMLIGAVLASALAGFVAHSALDDVESEAELAQMNAISALNQANSASSQAHRASFDAQQALLQARPAQAPALPAEPSFPPVVRSGTVTEVTGAAPAALDDSCVVTVISRNGGQNLNCQVSVRCGDSTIYGAANLGYLVCGIKDGQPAFGRDDEGGADPMLELDLAGNSVVVRDGPESAYAVTISLETL